LAAAALPLLLQVVSLDTMMVGFTCQSQIPVVPPTQAMLDAAAQFAGVHRADGNGGGLASRPSAVNKIYLDFRGGTITNSGAADTPQLPGDMQQL
jgi:hypothetical protein